MTSFELKIKSVSRFNRDSRCNSSKQRIFAFKCLYQRSFTNSPRRFEWIQNREKPAPVAPYKKKRPLFWGNEQNKYGRVCVVGILFDWLRWHVDFRREHERGSNRSSKAGVEAKQGCTTLQDTRLCWRSYCRCRLWNDDRNPRPTGRSQRIGNAGTYSVIRAHFVLKCCMMLTESYSSLYPLLVQQLRKGGCRHFSIECGKGF